MTEVELLRKRVVILELKLSGYVLNPFVRSVKQILFSLLMVSILISIIFVLCLNVGMGETLGMISDTSSFYLTMQYLVDVVSIVCSALILLMPMGNYYSYFKFKDKLKEIDNE